MRGDGRECSDHTVLPQLRRGRDVNPARSFKVSLHACRGVVRRSCNAPRRLEPWHFRHRSPLPKANLFLRCCLLVCFDDPPVSSSAFGSVNTTPRPTPSARVGKLSILGSGGSVGSRHVRTTVMQYYTVLQDYTVTPYFYRNTILEYYTVQSCSTVL